ncbi:hypothetical protein DID88_010130 [Monilinia fructigena]|uniref:Carboxylesterase type B domain-containing protein n=1 Tax=Monilinia fructigena TaxID=38457 RepID=A0A395IMC8_9HELO|nr:hypothetical protein DID88_010130 [Monilinia fructigena]
MPVIVWFFGDGFVQGGTNSLYYNPQTWVQRTQEHIVITVNFRSNIFGFPNAAHLTEQNLGILDMRLALEWVRDNVVGFGGDPSKIIAWGQSAGAIAIDYLSVAYPSNPIFSGMILDSGTAFYPRSVTESFDTSHSNFSSISAALGCNVSKSEIDCLRNATWQDIEAAVQNASSIVNFLPVSDERIVFANYTERFNTGFDTMANFPNISPPEYPGAYHAAELPLLFGTAAQYHGLSTEYEDDVSEKFQDLWVKFAKNTQDGLRDAGWSPYEEGKAILIGGTDTPLKLLNITDLDGAHAQHNKPDKTSSLLSIDTIVVNGNYVLVPS